MSANGSLPTPGVVVVRVRGPVTRERAQRLYKRLDAELARPNAVCVICRVARTADMSVVDVLARIALIASRRQAALRVTTPCRDLKDLLTLTGLASLVSVELESLGEAEAAEEGGIEEVVDVDDLTA
jgi:MFS superfamily sulfate permease-like transporter